MRLEKNSSLKMDETKVEGTSEMDETKMQGTSEMEETARIYPSLSQLNFYGVACLLSFFLSLSLSILSVTGILYSQ